ncbi:trypsin-like peptidase domain-containing protein [Paenibacillus sp. MMS20-IR301]|uniref:S1C family serine protease n=1 Tax=Paenibacillus sp. MMS20-IR301 TaxID=2895946 RepID=UPI0028ED8493|nr:trypsin-like peptidase domain-containing protein [Paenibacillus sp. MMS20-IR301]WNS46532.1 trypsin-like peptidase domain-containing protein [Paenibacillus sp. MMS20-IR301]
MDDNKNNYNNYNRDNEPGPDRDWDNNSNTSSNANDSSEHAEAGSSYYYSYGPFKSMNNDEMNSDGQHYNRREPDRVEITPPQPVKPLPYNTSLRTTGYDGNGGRGGNPPEGNNSWQYNRKPKKPVKAVLVSFLAGMIVLSGSMVMADRGNWFTGDQAATVATSNTAAKTANGSATITPSTSTAALVTGSGDVSSVVDGVGPAVVKIETLVKSSSRSSSNPNMSDPFSQFFFGDQFGGSSSGSNGSNSESQSESNNSGSSQLTPYGIGTGFIYDSNGYILTNQHVVENADVIQVTVDGNTKPYEAKLLGSSKDLDLAVLKIEGADFPTVALGDSDSIKVGSEVVAIGNPQGFDHTVTAGVLSAKGRSIDINEEDGSGTRNYKNLLQTDASINPGNSGGPLLNLNGQVIGMNVAVSTDSQGIGFAIAVNTIKEVVDKLEANQAIPKEPVPFIGASLMTITDQVAQQMGTDIKEGSVVAEIVFKSPAYTADLRPYDIITGVNGTNYATSQDLITYIQSLKVGDQVTLNVVRDGKKLDLPVTIGNKNDFDTTQTQKQ